MPISTFKTRNINFQNDEHEMIAEKDGGSARFRKGGGRCEAETPNEFRILAQSNMLQAIDSQ
jgi:hypothetical protein